MKGLEFFQIFLRNYVLRPSVQVGIVLKKERRVGGSSFCLFMRFCSAFSRLFLIFSAHILALKLSSSGEGTIFVGILAFPRVRSDGNCISSVRGSY